MKIMRMQHCFVKYIPEILEDNTLYISLDYCTATHKCMCGCGNEVVTPITPTDWSLTYNGESVSLDPSIGNWSFDCQSHYWIKKSTVKWCGKWTKEEIESGRKRDLKRKQDSLHQSKSEDKEPEKELPVEELKVPESPKGFWRTFFQRLGF